MPFDRENFVDLSAVKLLQNIHSFHEEIACYRREGQSVPDFYYNYLQWFEEICLQKWESQRLPSFWFPRKKLIIDDELYRPPAPADVESYFDFLCSQKNVLKHVKSDWTLF